MCVHTHTQTDTYTNEQASKQTGIYNVLLVLCFWNLKLFECIYILLSSSVCHLHASYQLATVAVRMSKANILANNCKRANANTAQINSKYRSFIHFYTLILVALCNKFMYICSFKHNFDNRIHSTCNLISSVTCLLLLKMEACTRVFFV